MLIAIAFQLIMTDHFYSRVVLKEMIVLEDFCLSSHTAPFPRKENKHFFCSETTDNTEILLNPDICI